MHRHYKKILVPSIFLNCIFISAVAYIAFTGQFTRVVIPYRTLPYEERTSLFSVMPKATVDAVFLGDSITYRCEWSEFFAGKRIVNRGINGDNVKGMHMRIGEVAQLRPGKIFILGGLNDLGNKTSIDAIVTEYRELISSIRKLTPATRIYVQSILPIEPGHVDVDGAAIVETNRKLKELALSMNTEYIDLYPRFADAKGSMKKNLAHDGVHLNGRGYLLWKECIEKYL